MKIYFTKWLWKLFLLATLLTFSGCIPEKKVVRRHYNPSGVQAYV